MTAFDTTPRKRPPNMTEKLAAALLQIKCGEDLHWLIPEPLRSAGTAQEICQSVEWDHWPRPRWIGGGNEPQNLDPLPVREHREKSKLDTAKAAKTKRVATKHALPTSERKRKGRPLQSNQQVSSFSAVFVSCNATGVSGVSGLFVRCQRASPTSDGYRRPCGRGCSSAKAGTHLQGAVPLAR